MRRRDPVRIGDALNDFFSSTPVIARKIAEAKIPDLWPVLVGNSSPPIRRKSSFGRADACSFISVRRWRATRYSCGVPR